MGQTMGKFSRFLVKELHDFIQGEEQLDVPPKPQNEDPLPMHYVWIKFTKSNPIFQATAFLGLSYALYRWIVLPLFQDYFLAEKCRFKLENLEPLKAGDSVVYTVSGFLPPKTLEIEEIDDMTSNFFNSLIVKLSHNGERIPVMKAYAEDDTGRIKVVFSVDKSGLYNMELRYNGFLIPGSPHEIIIPPDSMYAESTEVLLPGSPVIITDGIPQTIEIFPKDRTGYPCCGEGVRLDKFDFHASTDKAFCNVFLCGKTLDLIGGGCWKEGLDANFSFGGSAVSDLRVGNEVKVMLNLRTNRSPNSYGVFEGQICYDCHIVKCFPIVSLTCDEYEKLESILMEPKPTNVIQLKGEILRPDCEVADEARGCFEWYMHKRSPALTVTLRPKEVHLNISMKFICVKEVVWTVLLSRTALFSIQGDTKIEAVPETDDKEKYIVTITDESGNEIRLLMHASSTRMLMALFLKFRSNITGSELTFFEKSNRFFEFLGAHCRKVLSFHKGNNFQLLNISRPDALRTSNEETKTFDSAQWYNPFIVSFLSEPLLADDEAWLEWAELILDTILENNPNGMFHKISDRSGFVHPNSSRNYRRWSIQYYELAGKLVGKYLVERALNNQTLNYRLKVRFSRSFLLQLIGSTPTLYSLERDMPELYDSTLKTLTKNNFDDGVLTFCVPLYDIYGRLEQMVPLMENGEEILVTNDNADLYLNALARHHLRDKVNREIAAFRSGLTLIIPEDLLLNFDENELELLICGWSKLDVRDVKTYHVVVGENWHPEFPRILKWLWQALEDMTSVDHAQFLQFSTGSSILPLGGFAQLSPRLTLSMTCLYGQSPVADPSAHSICFSDHRDYEAFNAALYAAMRKAACCQDKPNVLECIHPTEAIVNNNSNNLLSSI